MSFRNSFCLAAALAAAACHPAAKPPATAFAPGQPGAVLTLHQDIDGIIGAPALQRGYWGVLVKSLKTGETLYAWNAGKLMMPASNMKIVTLAVAAERLGWDYRFETRLLAAGRIDAGSLDGDLVVVGSGDPSMTAEAAAPVFDDWAARLKAAGVTRVAGRIVGDDAAFDHEALGMGWSWDDLQDGYATGVGALQFNENVARVVVAPGGAPGGAAAVSIAPDGSGISIHNDVTTAAAADPWRMTMRRLPGSVVLELRGAIPFGSEPRALSVSVPSPTQFFVNALRSELTSQGIDVRGPAVDLHDAGGVRPRPESAPIAVHQSAPLLALAATMMKLSQNLYAETLLKTLGEGGDAPASIAAGREVVQATLKSWNVAEGSVIERDGSGLSRYNYVSPEALVAVLTRVDRDPRLRDPFEASLPMAGRDGTLATRTKGTPAEARVRAKTGSMANVRALSGYAMDADDEPLVFSILANNFEGSPEAITKAIDAIVVRIAGFRR